ncbi:steroid delta-isomerase-like uncharacterized protein [Actinoalloteichus hoggarensis]|uniref:SnoaL-like polyketide cyclase n=1 Tax=Actinoalloteichus hoggarensis TaxID=1470176 RepID=A0A221W474_9PSEU|nr:ester cyclase [Actinoalloteichus hoggarensis]ASO20680.1 SnoaL-like polyketide cyclase [Actinoalloteichus hoggarensis]MBB5924467.1 steroid delta-isomerase-like uncharacterized protein [Actinoalloteichus hoggarensis]
MPTPAEARRLVHHFTEAFNTGNLAHLDECIAEDYVQHNPDVPPGRAGLRGTVTRWRSFVTDLRVHADDVIAGEQRVVARLTVTGRQTGPLLGLPVTGRSFSLGIIDIWRIADGRFAEHWDEMDLLGLHRQLGLLPDRPESAR